MAVSETNHTTTAKPGSNTLVEAWSAFKGVVQASSKLIPGLVAASLVLTFWVTWATIATGLPVIGVTALLVLVIAITVYAKTNSYGEAALSLVGGLLTVFSVNWTPAHFWIFVGVLTGFSLSALIISSVKIAANVEDIYLHAAISITERSDELSRTKDLLHNIGTKHPSQGNLGPVQRAEAVRVLTFRKIPLDSLASALDAIGVLATVTKVDPKSVALFIADVTKILQSQSHESLEHFVDEIFTVMRDSPASPQDFIKAFEQSRRVVLSCSVDPSLYFRRLGEYLAVGVAPEKMDEAFEADAANEKN